MLVKKLIPAKFLAGTLEIVMAAVLLATASVYPTLNNTSVARYQSIQQASQ